MTLTVSNTLSGETEVFEPTDPGHVSLYYCGLTVSDDAHLGHARSWVHTDVIRRWLEHLGYEVTHVENFTDVNEKIIARVGVDGEDEASVARTYIARIIRDMRSLRLERASVYPRVSEHIPQIIELVETLIEAGHAYEANGSVYFDVTTFPEYGKLSNQHIADMEVQAEEGPLAEKRHPQDFALWKAGRPSPAEIAPHQPPDEGALDPADAVKTAMTFDSPWSEGRPGWHIECSAMSTTHLGETFDIHIAGHDILFPHNENEIAQSEAATRERFARYWLHTGLLQTDGEKMSSSLRNYFRVRDAVDRFGPNVLRTFFLSTSYHAEQHFDDGTIAEAQERWSTLERAYERAVRGADSVDAQTVITDEELRQTAAETRTRIHEAMNDDFDTRTALVAMGDLAGGVNRHVDRANEYDYQGLRSAIEVFEEYGESVFGLVFTEDRGDTALTEDVIELVLAVREEERAAGNFERADELRDRLERLGIAIEDTEGDTTYRLDGY